MPIKPETIVKETARQLKSLRLKRGMSHEALAQRAGVTRPAISHIEAGKRKPSLLLTLKICQALGIRLSEILRGVEKK
jgi:DNA-binding XRE family transcriptional regulator